MPQPSTSPGPGVPSDARAAIVQELERIAASSLFRNSERMARFLRFIVEMTLEGRGGELKEYTIGTAVFDRGADFDPRVDPIVRVEARRLRDKLSKFYSQSTERPVAIRLAKGTYVPEFELGETAAAVSAPRHAPDAGFVRIAVLPLANLAPEADQDYFSDGLTAELIHRLTQTEYLRVVAWTSSSKFKETSLERSEIGRQLRVEYLLEGSVRRSGRRLRITSQLVDVATSEYVWSRTFDRQSEDVIAIQEEIAGAIVALLTGRLGARQVSPRLSQPSFGAYNLYLRGRFFWNKRTAEGLQRSVELYRQSVAADPQCAQAYAGLADAYGLLGQFGMVSPEASMPLALEAARQALSIDPGLAEAHTSLGFVQSVYEWNWKASRESFEQAIRLNPGYAYAHHWYSLDHLALVGEMEEARREIHIALHLDPLSESVNEGAGYLLMLERRYEESLAHYLALVEMMPHFYRVFTATGRVLSLLGRYDEAIGFLERGRAMAGDIPSILGAMGQTYGWAGRKEEACGILEKLESMAARQFVPSNVFAVVHSGLGETEKAIAWLEHGLDRREAQLASLNTHPVYDQLRGHTGFQRLLARMNFISQ